LEVDGRICADQIFCPLKRHPDFLSILKHGTIEAENLETFKKELLPGVATSGVFRNQKRNINNRSKPV
jgi:hypothetical protein